ncbi:similar to Saccharomyces cerevisiae YGR056W RSC1 Component of the RSC chromatin remodeling complex [Maudiozyma saulgeensis]|uniref:Similar to Saccharomyces cerevisiae YGR056W RSC1 Component of the RSC chromatin remodeling complex n=1 Tax=Maudiozyma saulgeensis TaxID=1789683 RepID=A0A1X7QZM1_9SACH|nr:similar to Saccharomyces cerevisiae YGR056W RSC1 Component of the RSC chromatin remodeling complex [Kazachstania saulgeensis]
MVIVIRSELEGLLRTFYGDIFALKEDGGMEIYPIFNILPDRKLYMDYYEQIEKPISLNTLKKRIPHYTEAQDFLNDVAQMAWNAKTYNTKESEIHKYAKVLEKYLINDMFPKLQEKYPHVRYPYLGPLPDAEDEAEQIALRDKQRLQDEKNGIKPEDLIKAPPTPVESKKSPDVVVERPRRNMRTMEERKVVVEDSNDEDENYNPMKKNTSIRATRLQPRVQYDTLNASDDGSTYSRSNTPQMTKVINLKSNGPKTSIRRGRPPVIDLPYLQRVKNVLKNVRRETDRSKNPLISIFEYVPDEMRRGKYLSMIPNPICIEDMRTKLRLRTYPNFPAFQNDIAQMLSNYRLFYGNDREVVETINRLEKVFKVLCKHELARPDKYFLSDGILRYPIDSITVNNVKFVIGDWVLLKNPNDPSKPIIAEIFKLWRTEDGQEWLNACWYFRPEQTVHRVDRLFYKKEVMKTGQYRDHVIEDVVGKCYVIHFTRYQRGDPEFPVKGPQFVCEYRYNESDKIFNKIRTWKACLPEEVRDIDEPTIPINGRKFFKYPSPIRNLLSKDATVNSKIPPAVQGNPAGPPLVGAVYMRPQLDRDDLGEYSTSPDCPRHIIRPGDPPEEGKIDFESGTIITDSITTTAFTKPFTNSQTRLSEIGTDRYPGRVPSSGNFQNFSNNYKRPILPESGTPLIGISQDPLTAKKLADLQIRRFYTRQQMLSKKNDNVNQEMAQPVKDVSLQMTKTALIPIDVDHPRSYILPISITKNINVLQRTDYENYQRTTSSQSSAPLTSRKRFRGEALWFNGPSMDISERYVNLGEEVSRDYLNKIFKKTKLDYEETTEILDSRNRILSRHQQAKIISKYHLEDKEGENNLDEDTHDATNESKSTTGEEHEFDDENRFIPGTFVFGLRPSSKFIAHKLKLNEII